MPNVFLSHNSLDKPFVEKLANDLRRVGVVVWFDKWEIKVGESLTWKIEEGIRENEYLAIILSPEAVKSEWVKFELGAAWARQMQQKRVAVLPILYRDCELPVFLLDRKYADFRQDYDNGFKELAAVFGIANTDTVSLGNWRIFAKAKAGNWQEYREKEFKRLVTALSDKAREYNWNSWVGSRNNHRFSITLNARIDREKSATVSINLSGKTYAYMASRRRAISPGDLSKSEFDVYVGNTVDECEEYVWRIMEDFKTDFGNPTEKANHQLTRFLSFDEKISLAQNVVKAFSWYDGDAPC